MHRSLTSSQRKFKTLKFKKQDNKEVTISLYGYPVVPTPQFYEDGVPTDFLKNLEENNPDLVMVQVDPMAYLSRARTFALANMPMLRE